MNFSNDVDSAVAPTNFINLNGNVIANKTFAFAIQTKKDYFTYLANTYKGPVSGEGNGGSDRYVC